MYVIHVIRIVNFEIISSNERITVEENIKPVDSNSEPVNHQEAIKKRE